MAKLFEQEHKTQQLSYFPSLLSGEVDKLLTISQILLFLLSRLTSWCRLRISHIRNCRIRVERWDRSTE